MDQPISSPYPISDFLEWEASRQLEIQPKFQRRDVWIPTAKSYLIDTILRRMPIPPLFIRMTIDPINRRTLREVVDGQQRIRAVFSFIRNEFCVQEVHSEDFGGMYYADLPNSAKKTFLGYKFIVNTIEDVSDSDVLNIFARLNTYPVKLSSQELRNAKFFGAFKQNIYKLASKHYAFWRNNNILSDRTIARMGDAELVSELVISMIDGIGATKAKDINKFYQLYDDEFPNSEMLLKNFVDVINVIGNIFDGDLKSSPFQRIPLFYSLFCATYDAMFGLPKSKRTRINIDRKKQKILKKRLNKIGKIIRSSDPPSKYDGFLEAARLSTADPGKRRLRHKFIWDNVFYEL